MKCKLFIKKAKGTSIQNKSEIKTKLEFFLRFIEVIIIGAVGVIISIKANSIAESQLKIEKINLQPYFSINEFLSSNDKAEPNAIGTIVVENIGGQCNNIKISTQTCINVTYSENDSYDNSNMLIKVRDYFGNRCWTGNTNGKICELSYFDNHNKFSSLYMDLLKDETYHSSFCELSTVMKIDYVDLLDEQHTEYYLIDLLNQTHLTSAEGQALYDKYNNVPTEIGTDDLSLDKILNLIKENNS